MKKLIIIFFCLLIIYFSFNSDEQNINVTKNIDIDNYVYHVLSCEMPALFNEEALKAQAVAIRTYYLYKVKNDSNYTPSNSDQCYLTDQDLTNRWNDKYDIYSAKLKNVVNNTKNEVIMYDNDLILPLYFSISNGFTENNEDVFGSYKPYLVSTYSPWDKDVSNFEVTKTFSEKEFLNKLGIGGEEVNIGNIFYSASSRVKSIYINDVLFSGVDVRKALDLRSTDFSITNDNGIIEVTTKGYGHGVGMSQWGANFMAKEGYNYKDIISHYYKNAFVSYINV